MSKKEGKKEERKKKHRRQIKSWGVSVKRDDKLSRHSFQWKYCHHDCSRD